MMSPGRANCSWKAFRGEAVEVEVGLVSGRVGVDGGKAVYIVVDDDDDSHWEIRIGSRAVGGGRRWNPFS